MKAVRIPSVIALFVCMCAVSTCWGFPGLPLTVVERWTDSSLVVFADVTSVEETPIGQEFSTGLHARLSVRGVLKGHPVGLEAIDVVETFGFDYHHCSFRKGQRILAFLSFNDELKMYTPVGSPRGCIEVDEASIRQYSIAFKELPAILDDASPTTRTRRLVDWSVDCAMNAATRADGTLQIAHLRSKLVGTPCDPLSSAHKAKLLAAILTEIPPGKDSSDVVGILQAYPSPGLDRYLLESLQRSHELGWSDLTREAVEHLPKRLGIELDLSTQQRLKEYSELATAVYYTIDHRAEPERYARDKKRLDILWGAVSREIYYQCKEAVESEK